MAKISVENRNLYFQKTKLYRSNIESILSSEDKALKNNLSALKYLDLAEEMIFLASNCIILNSVSEAMLETRNGAALNEGRKSIYKAVIYLEKVVSPLVDAPYSEYEDKLNEISQVDSKRRYTIAKKLGLAINLMENAFGDNSKWKWAFVELVGRYSAVAKNLIDLRGAVANIDPRSPDYEPTFRHLKLAKRMLQNTADRYRRKYESVSKNPEDLNLGIQFLESLRRIHIVLGEKKNSEVAKKTIDVWKQRQESNTANDDRQGEEILKNLENG